MRTLAAIELLRTVLYFSVIFENSASSSSAKTGKPQGKKRPERVGALRDYAGLFLPVGSDKPSKTDG